MIKIFNLAKLGDSINPPPTVDNNSSNISHDEDVIYSEPYEDWYEEDQHAEIEEVDEIDNLEAFLDAEVMLPK